MPNSDDFDDVEIVPFEDKLVDKNLTWYHNDDKVHDRNANDNSNMSRYFDQGCKTASRSQVRIIFFNIKRNRSPKTYLFF